MLLKWLNIKEIQEDVPNGLLRILPKKKQTQIEKYRTSTLRQMHYRGWYTLTEMLIEMGFSHTDVSQIQINKYGKPFDPQKRFFFSISYSYPYILVATSKSEIGIDIEKHSNITMDEMELFLHPEELDDLGINPSQSDLYDVWSKKEAILKLIGKGFQVPPETICTTKPENKYLDRLITTQSLSLPFKNVSAFIAKYR